MAHLDEAAVSAFISNELGGVMVQVVNDDSFFFFDPTDGTEPDNRFPFATLVTGDRHDQVSNLDREGVYRLNVGVGKATFERLFGPKAEREAASIDYAQLDRLMPHPVYGSMYWLAVLNPSPETFEQVKPLLVEARSIFRDRYEKRSRTA